MRATSPGDGQSTCGRAWTKTAVHRQGVGIGVAGLRRLWWERLEAVPPGGNSASVSVEGFEEQCDYELCKDPSLSCAGILVGKVTKFEELLEALECQLDLPAKAIELEDVGGGQRCCRQRRENHHEVGSLQRSWVRLLAFLDRGFWQRDAPPWLQRVRAAWWRQLGPQLACPQDPAGPPAIRRPDRP